MNSVNTCPAPLKDLSNVPLGNDENIIVQEHWYYPAELANDLKDVDFPSRVKEEIFATSWEYSRSVIPQYTNWARYVAFMRIIIIGTVAEFRGELINVVDNDDILGYNLKQVLDTLFEGTPGHVEMAREFRCFLLVSSHKSRQIESNLFKRYAVALSRGPYQYFRMRDTDALVRLTMAAALACSNLDEFWLTNDQFDTVAEIGITMYDAIAFWKHRAEGETNNLFAYVPDDERVMAYHTCREALWALDVAWSSSPAMQVVTNFLRLFGGPIHMMMRRYRFVEEGLALGRRETEHVIDQTRNNHKLWNRVDGLEAVSNEEDESSNQYERIVQAKDVLFFEGLAEMLEIKLWYIPHSPVSPAAVTVMLLSLAFFAALVAAFPTTLVERAMVSEVAVPIDLTFEVIVPTSPTSGSPYVSILGPYRVNIPQTAKSGTLISWLGNYASGKAYNTQVTSLDPTAPRNITTNSTSTQQEGGNSFTNATALAEGQKARVVTTSFSSGNAASAAAAALDGTGSSSTSSSGTSNSTAVATSNALGEIIVFTSANTANALNSQSILFAQRAEAATSCAADSGPAASSEADRIDTLAIPIGQSPDSTETYWLTSSAYAACSAGDDAPSQTGSSSSGSQASLLGSRSTATCNGVTSTQQKSSTTFRVTIKGTYTVLKGFNGAVGGQRVASSSARC
ncbi:hypothetical protein N0V86_006578 [Didymella sp. IMI 355093]|nr:hypothetical protein N0V86_006578 [Didymella sp. IMI 355093]